MGGRDDARLERLHELVERQKEKLAALQKEVGEVLRRASRALERAKWARGQAEAVEAKRKGRGEPLGPEGGP